MSPQNISVWDWVIVVRSCCTKRVNHPIFQVGRMFKHTPGRIMCALCGTEAPNEVFVVPSSPMGQPISWVKKIPPLHELLSTNTNEPVAIPEVEI